MEKALGVTLEGWVAILASAPLADLCEVLTDELVELSERHRVVKLVVVFLKRQAETEITARRFPPASPQVLTPKGGATFDSCSRKSLNSEAVTGGCSLTCL